MLDDDTKALVEAFYCSDEVSRMMPGKNDWKSVIQNGTV